MGKVCLLSLRGKRAGFNESSQKEVKVESNVPAAPLVRKGKVTDSVTWGGILRAVRTEVGKSRLSYISYREVCTDRCYNLRSRYYCTLTYL